MYQLAVYGKRLGGPLTWTEATAKVEQLKWSFNGVQIKRYLGEK